MLDQAYEVIAPGAQARQPSPPPIVARSPSGERFAVADSRTCPALQSQIHVRICHWHHLVVRTSLCHPQNGSNSLIARIFAMCFSSRRFASEMVRTMRAAPIPFLQSVHLGCKTAGELILWTSSHGVSEISGRY